MLRLPTLAQGCVIQARHRRGQEREGVTEMRRLHA